MEYLDELEFLAPYIVNRNRNHLNKLEIELFRALRLAKERDCKLLFLAAHILLVKPVNYAPYLEYSERRRI